jgi:hypothetical protein
MECIGIKVTAKRSNMPIHSSVFFYELLEDVNKLLEDVMEV